MDVHDRFFDVETGGKMELSLQRDGDSFKIPSQFGYRDDRYDEPFIVPADPGRFRTDLASIPWVFAWLIPGVGSHLPAVLLHDALVVGDNEGKTHVGPDIDRVEADRIFRDAMGSLGTPRLRRWLMWTAVSLATAWVAPARRWLWRILAVATFAVVIALGSVATVDLFDVWDILPWMGERTWWMELLLGAAAALITSLALSLPWWRRWRSAAIGGVAVAFLLHVTVAVALAYAVYSIAEKIISFAEGTGPSIRKNRVVLAEASAAAASEDAATATR